MIRDKSRSSLRVASQLVALRSVSRSRQGPVGHRWTNSVCTNLSNDESLRETVQETRETTVAEVELTANVARSSRTKRNVKYTGVRRRAVNRQWTNSPDDVSTCSRARFANHSSAIHKDRPRVAIASRDFCAHCSIVFIIRARFARRRRRLNALRQQTPRETIR